MSFTDPWPTEDRDPFYVPDRTAEMVSFFASASAAMLDLVALAVVPFRPMNVAIISAIALVALLSFLRAIAARRRRLSRARQANELRARLLQREDSTASS